MVKIVSTDDRIELFAREYVKMGARHGAIRAACTAVGIEGVNAGGFFRRKDVQARISELLIERYGELDITAKKVMEEMGAIAFFDPGELFDEHGSLMPIHQLPPRVRAAIASLDLESRVQMYGDEPVPVHTIKIRFHSKNEILKTLAQHFKLINDNSNVNALAAELTKQLREGRERAKALRREGVTDAEDAVIIPQAALPQPVEREDYA